jgi:tetratricopeptide (TPR) repeat protein
LTKQEIAAAIVTAQASVAQAERIFPRARQHWISPRVQLAVSHRAAGHFQIADDMLRETLDLLKELGRERTADAMLLYNTWGIVKADIGDIAGAVRMFEASLGVGHALWGDTTVSQWVSVNYGRRLLLLNKIDAGEENIANALERSSGEDDAEMQAAALLGLIAVNRVRGDLQAAKAARVRAEQFIREQLPPEHTMHVNLLLESGLLDLADNSLVDAKTRLQQALSQFQRTNRRMSDQVVALVGITRCELQSGDLDRAAALATDATEFARKVALSDQPSYWLGLALMTEIDVQQALGHASRVRALSVEALAQLTPSVGADHPLTRKAAALAGLR